MLLEVSRKRNSQIIGVRDSSSRCPYQDLLSKTVPDHRDHPTLKNSLDRIAEGTRARVHRMQHTGRRLIAAKYTVAIFVNETIRDHEMQQVLVGVQRSLRGLTEVCVVSVDNLFGFIG